MRVNKREDIFMKKIISIILTLSVLALATSIFAANGSPSGGGSGAPTRPGGSGSHIVVTPRPSVTAPPAVTAAPQPTAVATAAPGTATTAPGTATAAPGTATAAPQATPKPTLPPAEIITPEGSTTDNEGQVVVDEMEGGVKENESYQDTTNKLEEMAKDDFVEYATFEVTATTPELAETINKEDNKISVTLDADIYGNVPFVTLVNYGTEWVEVNAEDIKVNGDGTVTVTLDALGAVSFLVDKNAEPLPTATPEVTPAPVATAEPEVTDAPATDAPEDKGDDEVDYTVDENVDYTVVSPQTGYAEVWNIACNIPAALR